MTFIPEGRKPQLILFYAMISLDDVKLLWLCHYCSQISKIWGSTIMAHALEKSHLNPHIQAGLGGKSSPTQFKGTREADPANAYPVLWNKAHTN